jgi:hypothetical protein
MLNGIDKYFINTSVLPTKLSERFYGKKEAQKTRPNSRTRYYCVYEFDDRIGACFIVEHGFYPECGVGFEFSNDG